MDINELKICREILYKGEVHILKCIDILENTKNINLQCFSTKEYLNNHLIYLNNSQNRSGYRIIKNPQTVNPEAKYDCDLNFTNYY
jgi:hypothetical protein